MYILIRILYCKLKNMYRILECEYKTVGSYMDVIHIKCY